MKVTEVGSLFLLLVGNIWLPQIPFQILRRNTRGILKLEGMEVSGMGDLFYFQQLRPSTGTLGSTPKAK